MQVASPHEKARDARPFAWLAEGDVVEVGPEGRAVLAFRHGRRQELAAGTRARLEPGGAVAERGSVRDLRPLPALADVLALEPEDAAGSRAGAVRVRGLRIRGLYPAGGGVSLADQTTLSFEPVRGAPRYQVALRDEAGVLAFEAVTAECSLAVPSQVLRSGQRYSWKVRTVDRAGPAAEGLESFRTLSAAAVEARGRLRSQIAEAGDAAALALLDEVDRGLGLSRETRRRPRSGPALRLSGDWK